MSTSLLSLIAAVTFQPPTVPVIIAIAITILLLALSAIVSGSEIAVFSLTPVDVNHLNESKTPTDQLILQLREDGERTLATILLTNNFVNVMMIMLSNYIFAQLVDFGDALWLQFLCITVLLTFLLLLFGEIMPKVFGQQHPLDYCRRVAHFLQLLRKLWHPLASLLMRSGVIASKVVHSKGHTLSVDDLEHALELTDNEEISEERSMLQGIIRFSDETAKEVMTSRQDIIDLDIKASFNDVLKCVLDNNYSRIPIYQDSSDNIRGVLYIKDLLPHIGKTGAFRWQSLIRPPYFVPETKKIDDLMREFQTNKVHIAIVVDEFGGTSGIITMEDILEEIVGEIHDEFDEEESTFVRLNNNTYLFEGKTLLSDFCKIINVDDEEFADVEGDADSLAGLLLELKGDFPKVHEVMEYKHYRFEILALEKRRIARVKVTITPSADNGAAEKN